MDRDLVLGLDLGTTRCKALLLDASGAEPATTNNRMELTGAIEGLASLKRPCRVELITDSQYVAKGIAEWLPKWKSQGWQRKEGGRLKPVMNVDLWQRIDELLARLQLPGSEIVRGAGGIAEGVPESMRDATLPKFGPRGILVVHAGGQAGLFSAIIAGWANGAVGSEPVTHEISR